MAKLYFRYGAMNSGKSTMLMQVAYNYEERGIKVAVVKPRVDTKGDKRLVSRIGLEREVDVLLEKEENIFDIVNKHYKDVGCILVDEAQFLNPLQVDQFMMITVKLNIPVIAYGLRTDFRTIGFPGATRLLELAHTIEELKTICSCGKKALHNARFLDGKFTITGDQVAIDGERKVTYVSMCEKCYYSEREKLEENSRI